MELTVKHIANGFPLISALGNLEFNASTNIKIARAMTAVEREYVAYEKVRARLINTHAKKDGEGKAIEATPGQVTLENPTAFNDELEKMLEEKVEVAIQPITFSDLGETKVRASLLAPLIGWFIADDAPAMAPPQGSA